MSAKRGDGEGTVYERADGRWEARVKDPVTGKRRSVYGATRAEARRRLHEMQDRKRGGLIVLDSNSTVEALADWWLAGPVKRRRQESTVREYERRLRSYVIPAIGAIKLSQLTVLHVEDMLDALAESGLARSSLQGTKNALSAMLADAVRTRSIAVNVASGAMLPDVAPRPSKPHATVDQVAALLESADGSVLHDLLVVLAFTGVRIGEALGAAWSDIDLDLPVWRVGRTTTLDRAGRLIVRDRTKTGDARILPLPPAAVEALRSQKLAVAAQRLRVGPNWQENGLVFPSAVGTPQDPRNLRKPFRDLASACGFPGSFHELRHFYASVSATEVSIASLSKILGHKRQATTTDTYGHLYPGDAAKAGKAVQRALGRAAMSSEPPIQQAKSQA